MIKKNFTIIIGIIILTAGAAYFANASGLNLFGGNSFQDNSDGSVLDITLSQDNYTSASRFFSDNKGGSAVSANAAVFVSDNYGKSTGAMSFNGSTDVVAKSTLALGASATFESWGYASSMATRMLWNHPSNSATTYYDLIFYNGFIFLNTGDGAGNPFKYPSGTDIPLSDISLNQWHHYVVVVDAAQNKGFLYIDGVYWGSANYKNPTSSTTRTLSIGGAGGYRWQGAISNLRIYNRVLSDLEVQALYNYSKPKLTVSSTQSGLIGYWPLDGDNFNATTNRVTDKTPYDHNGSNNGATLTTDRNGQANGAMSFNGSSWIDTGTIFPSINALMTISAWVKPGTSQTTYADIWGNHANYDGIVMQQNANNLNQYSWTYGNGSSWVGTGYFNLTANQWQHVVAIKDSQNCYVYINGVEQVSARISCLSNIVPSTGPNFRIAQGYSSGRYFNGSISDVRVYNRALSAAEVGILYGAYKPQSVSDSLQKGLILDAPLTLSWIKSEVAGSEIMTDRTPYSNDLQNYGATISSNSTSFDGTGNYYLRTSNNILLDSSQTYSVWINPNSVTGSLKGILTTHAYAVTANIGINQTDAKFNISIGYTDGTREYSLKPSNYTIPPSTWTHVVLLYDLSDNSVSFYINGEFDRKWNLTKPVKFVSEKILVGQWSNNYTGNYKFNGSLSSAKVYNRALSAAEIKSLYDKGR